MNTIELTIGLFPIIFMFHEFEEIIGFKPWFSKNGVWLKIHTCHYHIAFIYTLCSMGIKYDFLPVFITYHHRMPDNRITGSSS